MYWVLVPSCWGSLQCGRHGTNVILTVSMFTVHGYNYQNINTFLMGTFHLFCFWECFVHLSKTRSFNKLNIQKKGHYWTRYMITVSVISDFFLLNPLELLINSIWLWKYFSFMKFSLNPEFLTNFSAFFFCCFIPN